MNTDQIIKKYKNIKIGNPNSACVIDTIDDKILTKVAKKVISTYDLEDEIYATKESVFYDTRRIVARNEYNKVSNQLFTNVDFDDNLLEIIKPITSHICKSIPEQQPVLIQLATLLPEQSLKWHIDVFLYQQFTNKLHIPLFTNAQSFFDVFQETGIINRTNMKTGNIYNINNLKLHRSINKGNSYRTHLIIDFMNRDVLQDLLEIDINFFHSKIDYMSDFEKSNLELLNTLYDQKKLTLSSN